VTGPPRIWRAATANRPSRSRPLPAAGSELRPQQAAPRT